MSRQGRRALVLPANSATFVSGAEKTCFQGFKDFFAISSSMEVNIPREYPDVLSASGKPNFGGQRQIRQNRPQNEGYRLESSNEAPPMTFSLSSQSEEVPLPI
jgi:hypothetical protein